MSEASGVHACFAYLVDESGDRLVLRAASPPYERQVGKVAMERGEGLAWWAAERGEPAFIRDDALADPRTKYFPELEEERFQSLLAVPVVGRSGDVIGVITAHTEAPREFSDDEVDFLVTSASLVAGAIENARLYEEARLRVSELEQLTELAEAIARADALDELLQTVVDSAQARCSPPARATCTCSTRRARSSSAGRAIPSPETRAQTLGLAELGPELARGGRSTRLAVPLVANGELIGLLVAEGSARVELGARGREPGRRRDQEGPGDRAAHREEPDQGLLRGARGRPSARRPRGARRAPRLRPRAAARRPRRRARRTKRSSARCAPPRPARSSTGARTRCARSSSCRRRAPSALLERLRRIHAELAEAGRRSASRASARARRRFADGFAEAQQALLGTLVLKGEPTVLAYEELGAYKYLLRVAVDGGIRDATVDAVDRLAEYDAQRGSQLVHDARGVPAPPRQHQRDLGGALRPPEHAAPAPPPHRGALGPRPPPRRLADDRDRGEDGEAASRRSERRNPTHSAPRKVWRIRTFIAARHGW